MLHACQPVKTLSGHVGDSLNRKRDSQFGGLLPFRRRCRRALAHCITAQAIVAKPVAFQLSQRIHLHTSGRGRPNLDDGGHSTRTRAPRLANDITRHAVHTSESEFNCTTNTLVPLVPPSPFAAATAAAMSALKRAHASQTQQTTHRHRKKTKVYHRTVLTQTTNKRTRTQANICCGLIMLYGGTPPQSTPPHHPSR